MDNDGKKKSQWREVTNELVQVPIDQPDFCGCLFLWRNVPMFRIGWAVDQIVTIPGAQQMMRVASAVMRQAPLFKLSIDNTGMRLWVKEGVVQVPPSTIIRP